MSEPDWEKYHADKKAREESALKMEFALSETFKCVCFILPCGMTARCVVRDSKAFTVGESVTLQLAPIDREIRYVVMAARKSQELNAEIVILGESDGVK